MAYSTLPFHDLSVPQMQAISEQRERSGFHAYYQDGFENKNFSCICPWHMRDGCIFTTLFYFPSRQVTYHQHNSELCLGKYNSHYSDRIKLYFQVSRAMHLEYDRSKKVVAATKVADARAVRGFHVLQFVRDKDVMRIFVNGKEVVLSTRPTGAEIDDFVVFYTIEPDTRFVIWESHYTMNDTTLIRTTPAHFNSLKNIYFPHEYIYVSVGGYVMWSGTWQKGT
ncbi:hypothetical protein MTO96_044185, partial [Rhipicephalus appendiculatus]